MYTQTAALSLLNIFMVIGGATRLAEVRIHEVTDRCGYRACFFPCQSGSRQINWGPSYFLWPGIRLCNLKRVWLCSRLLNTVCDRQQKLLFILVCRLSTRWCTQLKCTTFSIQECNKMFYPIINYDFYFNQTTFDVVFFCSFTFVTKRMPLSWVFFFFHPLLKWI